ncbi:hypothetical protein ZOD2009_13266 [Haladaptatus paucihalophilus DX253]|uniref:Uncharacterized protein n=1 Tax=Haladaptatus paucihalophilus DX253 TaxID=797209 RepID=E7QV17_HALPU|nr:MULTISPECIES: hypothetical protein [Haladaptatus]EFW91535.1 hypothetical protein ZOD2009_13266 [Haladaptatus paucihalophilus DX253]SHL25369.1 hypothetical protein SAMN05444342_3428 [Haladaptatus paucihalophilus DX253]
MTSSKPNDDKDGRRRRLELVDLVTQIIWRVVKIITALAVALRALGH